MSFPTVRLGNELTARLHPGDIVVDHRASAIHHGPWTARLGFWAFRIVSLLLCARGRIVPWSELEELLLGDLDDGGPERWKNYIYRYCQPGLPARRVFDSLGLQLMGRFGFGIGLQVRT